MPIYLSCVIVDSHSVMSSNLINGISFIKRLSKILKRPEELIERQIFNILIEEKERKISNQFHYREPHIIIMEKKIEKKGRDREGIDLCGIVTEDVEEWINGKSGLPEGSSLKNFKEKGKISQFSERTFHSLYPEYKEGKDSFKYEAI